MIWFVIVIAAAVLAWLPWRGELGRFRSWPGIAGRFVAALAIGVLLFDPGLPLGSAGRPLVLLDNSLSMHAARGDHQTAAAAAEAAGEVVRFGQAADGGAPAGRSELAPALVAAVSSSRPVIVITDGEIDDLAAIPADLLARAEVRIVAGRRLPDAGIASVEIPARVTAGDTVVARAVIRASDGWRGPVTVELRDGERLLGSGEAEMAGDGTTGQARIKFVWPAGLTGERWLDLIRTGEGDGEPANDRRRARVLASATPGIVVVVTHPDWDGRGLYNTLGSVTEMKVSGFVRLAAGQWRRMEDLSPVPESAVRAAARAADLLAIRGDPGEWTGAGRSQLRWLVPDRRGDWYLSSAPLSPLSPAVIGLPVDSLPALPAIRQPAGDRRADWIGLTVREGRRGAEIPVAAGYADRSRSVEIGVSGLSLWRGRGGAPGQLLRGVLAQSVSWLLGSEDSTVAAVRPESHLVERGMPVAFIGGTAGDTLTITVGSDGRSLTDTLRFDETGRAEMHLPVGDWHYRTGTDSGLVVVEPFSREFIPGQPVLAAAGALVEPASPFRSARGMIPLFAVAVAGLVVEWVTRRRLALR